MFIRPADAIRATVVAGQTSTGYLLAGAGRPVLLIATGTPDPALLGSLASRFRVLAPEVPGDVMKSSTSASAGSGDFQAWLEGFMDGLGLPVVSLVVDPPLESTARAFAAAFPDRISTVAACNPAGGIDLSRLTASLGA